MVQEQKQRYAEQDLAGVPYNVYERGPPLPPCNKVCFLPRPQPRPNLT
jgi:hypothetical protein